MDQALTSFSSSASLRALYLIAYQMTLITFTMAVLFGNKVLFAACEVKFCSVARLRMDVLFEFGFIKLICNLARCLTTILSAFL